MLLKKQEESFFPFFCGLSYPVMVFLTCLLSRSLGLRRAQGYPWGKCRSSQALWDPTSWLRNSAGIKLSNCELPPPPAARPSLWKFRQLISPSCGKKPTFASSPVSPGLQRTEITGLLTMRVLPFTSIFLALVNEVPSRPFWETQTVVNFPDLYSRLILAFQLL